LKGSSYLKKKFQNGGGTIVNFDKFDNCESLLIRKSALWNNGNSVDKENKVSGSNESMNNYHGILQDYNKLLLNYNELLMNYKNENIK
jgi:hypothetical protein